jgi:phosphate transport system substrate-binding protein
LPNVAAMTKTTKLAGALVALALATAACGSDNNTDGTGAQPSGSAAAGCVKGSVTGAGSTFVATLAQQWIKDFGARCPGATVTYQGVGSGAGITQLTEGTVDFAGSDATLKPDEEAVLKSKGAPPLTIPWAAGAVAVLVNLPDVTDVKLSPATIAGMYAGKVTFWDGAAVKADNAGATLPHTKVQVVHRSDGSGTTKVFTSFLTTTAGDLWKAGAAKEVDWPAGVGAKGSDGVTTAVKQTKGAIGYAELSYAKAGGLAVAKVKNASGTYAEPSSAAVGAALAEPDAATAKAADAYPLATLTYVIARPGNAVVAAFVKYAIADGQAAAESLFYAPLPASVATKALADAEALS